MRPYIIGIMACIACPPAAVLFVPTLLLLLGFSWSAAPSKLPPWHPPAGG